MQSTERLKIFAAANVMLLKDNKIFLLRRANTGWEDGGFNLPAGHIEANEVASQAAIREAKEEALVDIDPKDLKIAQTIHRRGTDGRLYADFIFATDKWQGQPGIGEPDKCDDCGWFDLDNLPENLIPYLRVAINNYLQGVYYSEVGWDGHGG